MKMNTVEMIKATYEHTDFYQPAKKFLEAVAAHINDRIKNFNTKIYIYKDTRTYEVIHHLTGKPMGYACTDKTMTIEILNTLTGNLVRKELGPAKLSEIVEKWLDLDDKNLYQALKDQYKLHEV